MTSAYRMLCVLLLASTVCARAEAPVANAITRHINVFRGDKSGVTPNGDVWFWSRANGTIVRITAAGEKLTSGSVPDAVTLDVAASGRTVALLPDRESIAVLSWNGLLEHETRLAGVASDVAWVSDSVIVVTPQFHDHRVAMIDVDTGQLMRKIGTVPKITLGPGRHLARVTLVRYDFRSDEVVALDSTFGHVYVYSDDGTLIREARLPMSVLPVERYLRRDETVSSQIVAIAIYRFSTLAIDSDGTVWAGSQVEKAIFRFDPTGAVRRITLIEPRCRDYLVQPWNRALIFFTSRSTACPSAASTYLDYVASITPDVVGSVAMRRPQFEISANATGTYTWVHSNSSSLLCQSRCGSCPAPESGFYLYECSFAHSGCKTTCVYAAN